MFLVGQLFQNFDVSLKIKKMWLKDPSTYSSNSIPLPKTQSVIVTYVRSAIANTHSSAESFPGDVQVEGKGKMPS